MCAAGAPASKEAARRALVPAQRRARRAVVPARVRAHANLVLDAGRERPRVTARRAQRLALLDDGSGPAWVGADEAGGGQSAPLEAVVRQRRVAVVRRRAPREARVRAVAALLVRRRPHGAPARRRHPRSGAEAVGVDPERLGFEDCPARLHRSGRHAQRQDLRVEQVVAREVRQLHHDHRVRGAREVRVVESRLDQGIPPRGRPDRLAVHRDRLLLPAGPRARKDLERRKEVCAGRGVLAEALVPEVVAQRDRQVGGALLEDGLLARRSGATKDHHRGGGEGVLVEHVDLKHVRVDDVHDGRRRRWRWCRRRRGWWR